MPMPLEAPVIKMTLFINGYFTVSYQKIAERRQPDAAKQFFIPHDSKTRSDRPITTNIYNFRRG
jgi:hypothetical protein